MVRIPSSGKNGVKKGSWTPQEDKKLIDYITRYGHWNWHLLPKFAGNSQNSLFPKFAGIARSGKSCRLRWVNYLRPNLKRGNFTEQEEELIVKLHRNLGNRWSAIAAQLPGRTDNAIKNHWHTNLKKRSQQNAKDQSSTELIANVFQNFHTTQDSSPFSQHSSSSTTTVTNTKNLLLEEYTVVTSNVEDECSFWDVETDLTRENFWLEPYMLDISYMATEPDFFVPEFDKELLSHDDKSTWFHTTQEQDSSTFSKHSSFSTSTEYTTITSNENVVVEEYPISTSPKNLVQEDKFALWDVDMDLMSEIEPYLLDISYLPSERPECFKPISYPELWSHDDAVSFHTTPKSFHFSQHSSSSTSKEYTTATSNDNLVVEDEFPLWDPYADTDLTVSTILEPNFLVLKSLI